VKAAHSRFITNNRVILGNALSLVSTSGVTAALGFVYWWLAARRFPSEAVGLGSAAVSAMGLLGTISVFGLGSLLIGELPRQPGKAGSLISTALIVAGGVAALLALVFTLLAPYLSQNLVPLTASWIGTLVFVVGVSFNSMALVLDQAMVGLLRGKLQLLRNVVFAVVKLVALWAFSLWVVPSGSAIYTTWVFGCLVSLGYLAVVARSRGIRPRNLRPEWGFLRSFGRAAMGHHALNLALQGPIMMLPLLVTIQLSATANAYYYAAWMIASFTFLGITSLTTVLYAVTAAQPELLARQLRRTLELAALIALGANLVLQLGAEQVLSVFGAAYAQQAALALRVLALAAFPLIIRSHYVTLARIRGRMAQVAPLAILGGLFEIVSAAVGVTIGGLAGLSLGWVVALWIEAIIQAPTIYRAATNSGSRTPPLSRHGASLALRRALSFGRFGGQGPDTD